eukprot:GHVU01132775.1.p1 GENE.GHVU01132775.1~~GHVU01132775.1.p1  ORF type:complete len:207 (+),score=36.85 GHVU01132775.1:787-1407(+)
MAAAAAAEPQELRVEDIPPGVKVREPLPSVLVPSELYDLKARKDAVVVAYKDAKTSQLLHKERHLCLHTDLGLEEEKDVESFLAYCRKDGVDIRKHEEPLAARLALAAHWASKSKGGPPPVGKRLAELKTHLSEMLKWRTSNFPLSDTDDKYSQLLREGAMYWAARDACCRPLLIIRLERLPRKAKPANVALLATFCAEWALRYAS